MKEVILGQSACSNLRGLHLEEPIRVGKQEQLITQMGSCLESLDLSSSLKFKKVPRGDVTLLMNNLAVSSVVKEKIKGAFMYEERLLCFLIGNKNPTIVLTSQEVDPHIAGYYLGLSYDPDSSSQTRKDALKNAIEKTWLLSPNSSSSAPLCEKVNQKDLLVELIKDVTKNGRDSQNTVVFQTYTGSKDVDELSDKLGFEQVESPSKDLYWGSKTGSRKAFQEAGVTHPAGVPSIYDHDLLDDRGYILSAEDLSVAMARSIERQGFSKEWLIKLNEGFSGMGNAFLTLDDHLADLKGADLERALLENIARLRPVDENGTSAEEFLGNIPKLGAIAEAYIKGESASPSCQALIHSNGEVEILSTHDQVLDKQVYCGCVFPANEFYRRDLSEKTLRIASYLAKQGVRGHIAVDYLASKTDGSDVEELHAIEINLRMGGTSHPLITLKNLTDGKTTNDGVMTRNGQLRTYFASDNVVLEELKALPPRVLIKAMKDHPLNWNPSEERGVVFHLFGALQDYGKIGMTAIGRDDEDSYQIYHDMVKELKKIGSDYRKFEISKLV